MSLWYVMQVRAGAEENVRCQCLRLISSDILEHCFVPYYQQKKRFQGEWHIQETVLFPGYVFLVTSDLKQLTDSLRKATGMIRLLRTGEEIIPLSGEEVDLLLKLGREEQLVRMSTGVIENVYVKVFDGPLKGMEECIKKIDRYKRKAHIAIEMFAACVNFSRVCGDMDTADFDCIKDNELRTKAKFASATIDKMLFEKWDSYNDIKEVIEDIIAVIC